MNALTSPSFPLGAQCDRSELEARASRRALLEASMREEGASETMIARLATDETAAKMLDYEHQIIDRIASLFGPR